MFHRLTTLRLNAVQLTWLAAAFFTTIGNFVLWTTLSALVERNSLYSSLFYLSLPIFIFCLLNLMFTPVMVLPYVRKPLLALVLVISGACTYFMFHYQVLIDRSMVQNFFETNQAELASYFSIPLLLSIVLLGVVPAAVIVTLRTKAFGGPLKTLLWWLGNVLVSLAVLAVISMTFYKDYASLIRNNRYILSQVLPVNFIRSTESYFKRQYAAKTRTFQAVGEDAWRSAPAPGQRPKLLVVVVGETARAQNFQLNGYARATNPYLSARDDIISFQQVSSCGTATAVSLPCMFSRMPRAQFNEVTAATEENLLDILQRTGVSILWRNNNNGGCKGVCDRVATDDMPKLRIDVQCSNKDGTCYDDVLLSQLESRIDAMPGDGLIVLHQLGSHGPTYFERYPAQDKVFSPTCDSNQIQQCSNEALTNTYDNTLLYTDRMLSQTIDLLQDYAGQRDVAMVYISDHGESLGERGMYLHGTPYLLAPQQQTQVPLVMWFSETFAQSTNLDLSCLRSNAADRKYSQDNFYHSLLGLFDVQTSVYQAPLDLFAECRGPSSIAASEGGTDDVSGASSKAPHPVTRQHTSDS